MSANLNENTQWDTKRKTLFQNTALNSIVFEQIMACSYRDFIYYCYYYYCKIAAPWNTTFNGAATHLVVDQIKIFI